MNKVTLIGRLGRDPEARYTQGGSCVANLSLATTERRKTGDQWETYAEWHRVTVFGRTAENVAEYCRKGSQIAIVGRIQSREWEKDGHKNRTTEIVADDVEFLGGKTESEAPAKPVARPAKPQELPEFDESSIPF